MTQEPLIHRLLQHKTNDDGTHVFLTTDNDLEDPNADPILIQIHQQRTIQIHDLTKPVTAQIDGTLYHNDQEYQIIDTKRYYSLPTVHPSTPQTHTDAQTWQQQTHEWHCHKSTHSDS